MSINIFEKCISYIHLFVIQHNYKLRIIETMGFNIILTVIINNTVI